MTTVDAYVLRSSSGKTVLVIESLDPYYITRILRKLQGMREQDLKELFSGLEEYIDEH